MIVESGRGWISEQADRDQYRLSDTTLPPASMGQPQLRNRFVVHAAVPWHSWGRRAC